MTAFDYFLVKAGDALWWASIALLIKVVAGKAFIFIDAVYRKKRIKGDE